MFQPPWYVHENRFKYCQGSVNKCSNKTSFVTWGGETKEVDEKARKSFLAKHGNFKMIIAIVN